MRGFVEREPMTLPVTDKLDETRQRDGRQLLAQGTLLLRMEVVTISRAL